MKSFLILQLSMEAESWGDGHRATTVKLYYLITCLPLVLCTLFPN